jgi:hypothetical protein
MGPGGGPMRQPTYAVCVSAAYRPFCISLCLFMPFFVTHPPCASFALSFFSRVIFLTKWPLFCSVSFFIVHSCSFNNLFWLQHLCTIISDLYSVVFFSSRLKCRHKCWAANIGEKGSALFVLYTPVVLIIHSDCNTYALPVLSQIFIPWSLVFYPRLSHSSTTRDRIAAVSHTSHNSWLSSRSHGRICCQSYVTE